MLPDYNELLRKRADASFSITEFANPNHDEKGRFTTGPKQDTAQHFYHGTDEEFQPGDTLQPQAKTGNKKFFYANPKRAESVYITDSKEDAGYYGKHVYEVQPDGTIKVDHEEVNSYIAPSARIIRKVGELNAGTIDGSLNNLYSGETVGSLFQDNKTETKLSLTKRVTAIITNLHEFYNDCHDRTDGKFCKEGGKEVRIEIATPAQKKAARTKALEKIRNAPVPTKAAVKKAREELRRAKEEGKRAGGESRGGSAAARRQQAFNLFKEFGGLTRGYVIDHQSGLKMHYTSDPALNPKQYPTFERGKIFTKKQGGGYQLPNLIPEAFETNRSRLDRPVRKENLR